MKERIAKTNFYLYVLELEDDKYYIGISVNVEQRFETHKKQGKSASSFCKKYKPIRIIESIELPTKSLIEANKFEAELTWECINKYGYQNVRGWKFLSSDERVYKKYINFCPNPKYQITKSEKIN